MATYIRDDSLDNLQQSMSLLAQLAQRRKAQDLETAIAINRMGKNKEAEELILSSQRGLLGNLFGDEAKEWTVTNPFKKQKQEIYNVNADQGGLLAALTDPNSADYNPDMANLMAQGSPQTLSELSKMKEQGIMNLTPYAVQQQFKPQLQAYAENKQANDKIKAFNQKYAHMEDNIGGNEELQQQKVLQYAYDSIRTANTPQEQIKAYMDYRTKVKAINDHYGHQMQAESPAFFGIGSGSKKGESGSGKPDDVYIKDLEGNAIKPLKLTEKQINDKDIKKKLFEQYKEELATKGIYRWEDLDIGYASGNSFNLSTDDKMKNKISKQLENEKLQNALTMLNQSTGWDVGDVNKGTIIYNKDEAKAYIAGLGLDAYQDKDGKWRIKQGRGVATSQVNTTTEPPKTETKGKTPIYDFSTNPPKIVGYK